MYATCSWFKHSYNVLEVDISLFVSCLCSPSIQYSAQFVFILYRQSFKSETFIKIYTMSYLPIIWWLFLFLLYQTMLYSIFFIAFTYKIVNLLVLCFIVLLHCYLLMVKLFVNSDSELSSHLSIYGWWVFFLF
jgi:hypothetical protein